MVSPCALGAVLNGQAIAEMRAKIVVGAANNQLATDADGAALAARDILYAPDYVVNAGGIISACAEFLNEDVAKVQTRVARIPLRLSCVFDRAETRRVSPAAVADEMAEEIIRGTKRVPHDMRVAS